MPAKRKRKTSKKKSGAKPTNPALYARVKAEAKRKFDVYPSAYANAWLVRTYKKRGGGYKTTTAKTTKRKTTARKSTTRRVAGKKIKVKRG